MLGVVWLVWRVQFICSSFDFLINNFGSIRGNQKIFGKKKKREDISGKISFGIHLIFHRIAGSHIKIDSFWNLQRFRVHNVPINSSNEKI